jgi:cell division septum initiation protein DivIVA
MDEDEDEDPQDDGTVDILYLVDRLEELVGMGKRVPFSHRVMVEEEEFLNLVDQLRVAIPNEIKQAQRVIKDRERVVGSAQEEAVRILKEAKERSAYFASQEGILSEARQRSEEILRRAEEHRNRLMGEFDVHMLEQLGRVETAVQRCTAIIEDAVQETFDTIEEVKRMIAK